MPKFDTTLPEDFDGIFRFTNRDTEEFTAMWDGKSYTFPPKSTSPLIIVSESPLGIQSIRKKFAREWALKMFFAGKKFDKVDGTLYESLAKEERNNNMPTMNSIHQARTYSESDLAPLIQMCLEPLPTARAKVAIDPKVPVEEKLTKDEEGEIVTRAVKTKEDLKLKVLGNP